MAQQIPGHHVAGLQLDGLFEQTGGKREFALLLVDEGEEIARLGHLWNQLAGGFELGLCFGRAAQVVQNPAAIEMGDTGLRSKTDRLAGFRQRAGQVVTVSERKRQVQMGRGQIGRSAPPPCEAARFLRSILPICTLAFPTVERVLGS